jgi:hypothetical protein
MRNGERRDEAALFPGRRSLRRVAKRDQLLQEFAGFADSTNCGLGGAQDGFAKDESLVDILNKAQ